MHSMFRHVCCAYTALYTTDSGILWPGDTTSTYMAQSVWKVKLIIMTLWAHVFHPVHNVCMFTHTSFCMYTHQYYSQQILVQTLTSPIVLHVISHYYLFICYIKIHLKLFTFHWHCMKGLHSWQIIYKFI